MTKIERYSIGIALMGLAFALVATCSSCAAAVTANAPSPGIRSVDVQRSASVAVICPQTAASGVIISPRHILTAAHALCPSGRVLVRTRSGLSVTMTVDVVDEEADIARLVAEDPNTFELTVTPVIGYPSDNSFICVVASIPHRKRSCGIIDYPVFKHPGNIRHSAITVPGMSGSGVYNKRGQLLGIVISSHGCGRHFPPQICGGYFSSLHDRPQLFPKGG